MGREPTTESTSKNNDKVRKIKGQKPPLTSDPLLASKENKMPDTADSTQKPEQTQVYTPPIITDDTLSVVGRDVPHNYNVDELLEFIDLVFSPQDILPDAHRLVYSVPKGRHPGMPTTVAKLERSLRSGMQRALYFNTATCKPDKQGALRHRKELFQALHVLVLDDIGTKIPRDRIPTDMQPTAVVETSQGNYQYLYVLDKAITNVDHASALVQTASIAGLTDAGGVMATKIVRLPGGVNGKAGPKQDFPVRLDTMKGNIWTPKLLIERMRCTVDGQPVTWDDIQDGYSPLATKYHTHRSVHAQSSEGTIDAVLEWFYDNDMVLGDGGGDWLDIECPWGYLHSPGDTGARYSPVGRGRTNLRGFKCFHDHCKSQNTVDMIQWVLSQSDFDHIAVEESDLDASKYAFDPVSNVVWHIPTGRAWIMQGFLNRYNRALFVYERGKTKASKITAAKSWMLSPYRTVVSGAYNSPGSPVLFEKEGVLWVNPYRLPTWSDGQYDMKYVQPFLDFLEYLLPNEQEREYFTQWLAAKAQNPRFRGTGILMQSQAFGTGRGTLATMINQIWQDRTVGIEFDTLIKSQDFNPWELAPFVIVGEAKEANSRADSKGAYKAYETLKQRMDTSVVRGAINEKFQPIVQVDICSSYLLFTNHLNAVAMPKSDRRMTVLTNPPQAAPAPFFDSVYKWVNAGLHPAKLEEREQWAWHVWHWLNEHPVDHQAMYRPMQTAAKTVMVSATKTPQAQACGAVANYMAKHGLTAISAGMYLDVVRDALFTFDSGLKPDTNYLRHCMSDYTLSIRMKLRLAPKGSAVRLRIHKDVIIEQNVPVPGWHEIVTVGATAFPQPAKVRFAEDAGNIDTNKLLAYVLDSLPS